MSLVDIYGMYLTLHWTDSFWFVSFLPFLVVLVLPLSHALVNPMVHTVILWASCLRSGIYGPQNMITGVIKYSAPFWLRAGTCRCGLVHPKSQRASIQPPNKGLKTMPGQLPCRISLLISVSIKWGRACLALIPIATILDSCFCFELFLFMCICMWVSTCACGTQHGCWVLNSGPLPKQNILSVAEPSLRFLCFYCFLCSFF